MLNAGPGRGGASIASLAAGIALVFTDCDGVLTDTGIYYSARGEELRRFSVRDGMGVERLRTCQDIDTVILTREQSDMVERRGRKIGATVHLGVTDKLSMGRMIAGQRGLDLAQCAFIGDDLNDLELLQAVGLAGCPADAVSEVREVVHLVGNHRGGEGAFREFAEAILAVQDSARPPRVTTKGAVHAAHSRTSQA